MSETVTNRADSQNQDKSKNADAGSIFVPVEPFEIIVFGGTGDLARRKLIPSLYHRFCDGQIPAESKIIGASRSNLTRDEYLAMIKEAYKIFNPDVTLVEKEWDAFCKLVDYAPIDVTTDKDCLLYTSPSPRDRG